MQPSIEEVVAAACRLPIDYERSRTLSAVDVLRSTGYLAVRSDIRVEHLARYLEEHEECLTAWSRWSEDTRTTPAWFIADRPAGPTIVGYRDPPDSPPATAFDDRVLAYATYVHHVLEDIADIAAR